MKQYQRAMLKYLSEELTDYDKKILETIHFLKAMVRNNKFNMESVILTIEDSNDFTRLAIKVEKVDRI